MIELDELEGHQAEFKNRNTRVVVASVDGPEKARETQERFPHLVVVSDPEKKLISAAEVLHLQAGQHGEDVAAPTTFLIDKQGMVRWRFRPGQVITRLSAKEVLEAVDRKMPAGKSS